VDWSLLRHTGPNLSTATGTGNEALVCRAEARRRVTPSSSAISLVARWKDGPIVEENLFYDQIGVG
jgi:hypothetical protein